MPWCLPVIREMTRAAPGTPHMGPHCAQSLARGNEFLDFLKSFTCTSSSDKLLSVSVLSIDTQGNEKAALCPYSMKRKILNEEAFMLLFGVHSESKPILGEGSKRWSIITSQTRDPPASRRTRRQEGHGSPCERLLLRRGATAQRSPCISGSL